MVPGRSNGRHHCGTWACTMLTPVWIEGAPQANAHAKGWGGDFEKSQPCKSDTHHLSEHLSDVPKTPKMSVAWVDAHRDPPNVPTERAH
eukprot:3066837-Prymnesium_polylepis.1